MARRIENETRRPRLPIWHGVLGCMLALLLSSSACTFVHNVRARKASLAVKETLMECERSHSARVSTAIGTQLLAFKFNEYKSHSQVASRLSVARFCFSRALALSPDNYGASLAMGVTALLEAKALLYFRRIYEFYRRKYYKRAMAEHLAYAKDFLGRAYLLRSGQLEPLYYLSEIAILEGDFEIASRYVSFLREREHKPLDTMTLEKRIEQLQQTGLAGHFAALYARKTPVLSLPDLRNQHINGSRKFRVGFLSFGDGLAGQALPAMLLTELQDTGRFQIFEGGGIRINGQERAALTEGTAHDLVDGYLSGTIIKTTPGEMCFEIWLSNAVSHHVLYSKSVCGPAEGTKAGVLLPNRAKIKAVALDLARAIKQIQASTVIGVDDALVYLDVGASSGVIPGMVGYVLGSGTAVKDEEITSSVIEYSGVEMPDDRKVSTEADFLIGGVYIISVEENSSAGVFYREGVPVEEQREPYAIPGDVVYFK